MKRLIYYTVICLMALAGTSCSDEFMTDVTIGEGEAKVSLALDFKPMASALTRAGGGAAGDALKDIECLHVLVYGEDRQLQKQYTIKGNGSQASGYKETTVGRNPGDAENGNLAETSTIRATFSLPEKIKNGKYFIYAVANIPDLLTAFKTDIKTVDGLKSLPLTWVSSNKPEGDMTETTETVRKNSQMLGYFTSEKSVQPEDQPVIVNSANANLHAWLRRAASKVTIQYDGTGLKEGVFIYLQTATIKDIPLQCYLGKENNVGAQDYGLQVFPGKDSKDMVDGDIIHYHTAEKAPDFEFGVECADHRITTGHPHLDDPHDENASNALYFYENMQGAGDHMPDKRQDGNGDGALDNPGYPGDETYRLKDDVPYGTYVEVKAYYISNNIERLGRGAITYRFMLGQDVINDYNARRNCHYKLTLKFKGFANEADWHIEYEEPQPGILAPPAFISYLYNRDLIYPLKINTGGYYIRKVRAEIVENNWYPDGAEGTESYYDKDPDILKDKPWNGFLSLRKTSLVELPKPGTDISPDDNRWFYETNQRGEREYDFSRYSGKGEYVHEDKDNGSYRIVKDAREENTYNVYLPMYTRAKSMIGRTGYTGNNPYSAYRRRAKVHFTTTLSPINGEGGEEFEIDTDFVPIYQVHRMINPTGIHRSLRSNKPFHVKMMILPNENEATEFETFQSEGPWRAYVIRSHNCPNDGIYLSGGHSSGKASINFDNATIEVDAIFGRTGSIIDFYVNFDLAPIQGENRYALIRVDYHGYMCQHLIFVRQGDAPDDVVEGGTKWYAMNLKTGTELATNPMDEGSLFKLGNLDQPISALSNKNPREPWVGVKPGDFSFYPTEGLAIAGTEKRLGWNDIKTGQYPFPKPNVKGKKMRVASYKDYNQLVSSPDVLQGYGVLYGDDATETATYITDVYGHDNAHEKAGRGMRGCFVYNKKTGKNLFFPIGASGYGHRKHTGASPGFEKEPGILRYAASRNGYNTDNPSSQPLFYDIYMRSGAVYWLENNEGDFYGWDINFFSLGFQTIKKGSIMSGDNSDACFVRCVVDE